MSKANGSCLCGAVHYSFAVKEKHFDACHCQMCRKWGGGPALAVAVADPKSIEINGEENVKIYNSSDWAERGFCQKCGSHLFYRLKNGAFWNFNFGLLENQEDYTFTTQIYIDKKPHNYAFANETKMMTEKEVLEAFGFA